MTDTSELSAVIGFLNHLSIDELKDVLNDENKFEEITKDGYDKIKDNETSNKEMLTASSRSLSDYIVNQMDVLPALKVSLAELYDELKCATEKVNNQLSHLETKRGAVDTTSLLATLQSSTTQLEEETDTVSEKFLNGDVKLDEFIDQYYSQRKLLYMRKSRLEKFNAINNRRNSYKTRPAPPVPSANLLQNNMYPSVPNSFPPSVQSMHVPYPVGPSRMPMPGGTSFIANHF